jgi:hypothetical protein
MTTRTVLFGRTVRPQNSQNLPQNSINFYKNQSNFLRNFQKFQLLDFQRICRNKSLKTILIWEQLVSEV